MFVVSIIYFSMVKSHTMTLDDHALLREYANVFPDEILGMPLQRDINFWIDLVPRAEPIS